MEIRQWSDDRIQILLTATELRETPFSADLLAAGDPCAYALMHVLLEAAQRETGFEPLSPLRVELNELQDGGCSVVLSSWEEPLRRHIVTPVAYAFGEIDTLIDACVRLFRRYAHRIRKSTLYRLPAGFRLLVWPLDVVENVTLPFLDEYAARCGEGALAAAWLDEHAETLAQDNAIDLIASYFG